MKHKKQTAAVIAIHPSFHRRIVLLIGAATFFFGFAAGAVLNAILILENSPLVTHYRSTLSYKSSIFGDGVVLPIINMFAAAYILKHLHHVSKKTFFTALVLGFLITLYFHVTQAVEGIINWAMPTPWHWNYIGAWHAVYMFSVCSLLSLYYLTLLHTTRKRRKLSKESFLVTIGIGIFFILLRLDYITIHLSSLVPHISSL